VRTPDLLSAAQLPVYSCLLGMYLGDSYICRTRRTYRFHVSLYQRQEHVIERVVNAYWNAWPVLFPQHGAG
jgi:hypothetical protein